MGSSVLQGQHPHFQLNQVRKRAQSQTQRGSAASAWGAGETVGVAPPLLIRSPGHINRYMSAEISWPLEALKSGNWGQRGESGAKEILKVPSKRGDVGEKQEKWFLFLLTVQPHPHPSTRQLTEGEWERLRWCFLPFLLCFRPLVWRCWHSV